SEDPAQKAWLDDHLIGERELHLLARDDLMVDAGPLTNYSGYNMAFQGAWLAARYLRDESARTAIREGLERKLYDNPDGVTPQPITWSYSLFDFVYAVGMAGASVTTPSSDTLDAEAVARGVASLKKFPEPP